MRAIRIAVLAAATMLSDPLRGQPSSDPMRFFEGRTEGTSRTKVMLRSPFSTRSVGEGRMQSNGTLHVIQQVKDEGKPVHQRWWKIRRDSKGRYSGTMSDAVGPVAVQEIGGRYRFTFKMKGDLTVEEWITPAADGKTARNTVAVRKFGMVVARSEGTFRRIDD